MSKRILDRVVDQMSNREVTNFDAKTFRRMTQGRTEYQLTYQLALFTLESYIPQFSLTNSSFNSGKFLIDRAYSPHRYDRECVGKLKQRSQENN